ncbi:CoA transferase [Hyphomonas sp.]|uniref:CaiB/BaiF CoA-transferase family protein n=1 Tax=Hyphomonas sp. TaxID=87 RepID=UPI0032ECE946
MLDQVEILQVFDESDSLAGQRAISFAANLAQESGASIHSIGQSRVGDGYGFYGASDAPGITGSTADWVSSAPAGVLRVRLQCTDPEGEDAVQPSDHAIEIRLAPWETEETLFAHSGIAEFFGDPDREPLVPAGHFAAHSIGYAVYAALIAIWAKHVRFSAAESAVVDGRNVLSWVNWKSMIAGQLGMSLQRQGAASEWPLVECRDGHVAFVHNDRDWNAIKALLDDPALEGDLFETPESRRANRDIYIDRFRAWAKAKSKDEIGKAFVDTAIPGAPACTVSDLFDDPLLQHRDAIQQVGGSRKVPRPAARVIAEARGADTPPCRKIPGKLPLSGMRVLDFGIITAGAGVSALLADMGAEVLKIESPDRPDMFRQWPGAKGPDGDTESPMFRSNNRNKFGVGIDLKDPAGKEAFFELAKTADIVVENYRRGVLDRLGVDFESLRAVNPHILLASISGQGLDGPGAHHTTFGSTLEASCGLASMTRYPGSAPHISGINLNYPDQIICVYGAAVVAAHAVHCRENGVARQIDVSQRDCAIYQLGDVMGYVSSGGDETDLEAVRNAFPRPALSALFRCTDGRYVALSADDSAVAKGIDDLDDISIGTVTNWASSRSCADAVGAFISAGGGGAVSRTGIEMFADRSMQETSVFGTSPNGASVKGFPFQLVATPMRIFSNSPRVGEHTAQFVST